MVAHLNRLPGFLSFPLYFSIFRFVQIIVTNFKTIQMIILLHKLKREKVRRLNTSRAAIKGIIYEAKNLQSK